MKIRFNRSLATARDSFVAGKSYEVPDDMGIRFLNEGVAEPVADYNKITRATINFTVNPLEVATTDSIVQPKNRTRKKL